LVLAAPAAAWGPPGFSCGVAHTNQSPSVLHSNQHASAIDDRSSWSQVDGGGWLPESGSGLAALLDDPFTGPTLDLGDPPSRWAVHGNSPRIDPERGGGGGGGGLGSSSRPVPGPAAWWLAVAATAGLGGRRRRRA